MEEKILKKEKEDSKEKKAEEKKEIIEKNSESIKELAKEERIERIEEKNREEKLKSWVPKTKIGLLVKEKKIKDIDEVIEKYKILEPEIVDSLLKLKSDLLNIGQSKGKFGGGKRRVWRQTQRKTAESNAPTFSCLAVVGDGAGHVGLGLGKAKETLPAREKAIRKAKLNIIKINRGCGSFDCSCNQQHSLP